MVDALVDQASAKASGLVNYNNRLAIPAEGRAEKKQFADLRALINEPPENRLIVVFVEIDVATGYTALFPDWLPWVVVDPSRSADDATLLHEIGHACRLAHQASPDIRQELRSLFNVMEQGSDVSNHLWGWQVDTIFDLFWCTGPRPTGWSVPMQGAPMYRAFLWDEKP